MVMRATDISEIKLYTPTLLFSVVSFQQFCYVSGSSAGAYSVLTNGSTVRVWVHQWEVSRLGRRMGGGHHTLTLRHSKSQLVWKGPLHIIIIN